MKQPTLSIIVPAYNASTQISRMLDSILGQSYQDFELLVVDDHSTDNTATVVRKYIKKIEKSAGERNGAVSTSKIEKTAAHNSKNKEHNNKPLIKLISQPTNAGAAAARNCGIDAAHGRFLMFLDADDQLPPGALSTFMAAMAEPNVNLAVSGFNITTIAGDRTLASVNVCLTEPPHQAAAEPWRLYILRLLGLDGRLYQVWNKAYRADIIKRNNVKFPLGVDFGEDLSFNLAYFSTINGGIRWINAPLYNYYQDQTGGTFSRSSLIYANRLQNFAAVTDFARPLPNSPEKTAYLTWLKYDWLYSHLLAITSAHEPRHWKIDNLRGVAAIDGTAPLSDPALIGQRRYAVERMLRYAINHPKFGLWLISFTVRLKNSPTTARLWQWLRRDLNH